MVLATSSDVRSGAEFFMDGGILAGALPRYSYHERSIGERLGPLLNVLSATTTRHHCNWRM